jgi:hypothetical protein
MFETVSASLLIRCVVAQLAKIYCDVVGCPFGGWPSAASLAATIGDDTRLTRMARAARSLAALELRAGFISHVIRVVSQANPNSFSVCPRFETQVKTNLTCPLSFGKGFAQKSILYRG